MLHDNGKHLGGGPGRGGTGRGGTGSGGLGRGDTGGRGGRRPGRSAAFPGTKEGPRKAEGNRTGCSQRNYPGSIMEQASI